MTNSPQWAIVVAYAFAAIIPGNIGHLGTLPCPGDNKSMRAGKGNLFVGPHCKPPRRGGSAVHRGVGLKQENEFFFCMSNAGMLLKTKDRCGRGWAEAGMLLITKEISSESGNVIEKKEDERFLKAVTQTLCRLLRPPLTGPCRPSNLHKRLRRNIAKGFAILSCQACAGRRGDPWSAVVGPIPPCGIGQGRGKPRPYMNPQFEGRGLVLATFPKEPHYEKSYRSWRNILQS